MMTPPNLLIRPFLSTFAKELRKARVHAEMTQEQLAKRARMTRQGLDKIEKGGNCTLGTIILLAYALDCQVADFFPHKSAWS